MFIFLVLEFWEPLELCPPSFLCLPANITYCVQPQSLEFRSLGNLRVSVLLHMRGV